MLLDNLFVHLGGTATAAILLGIVAICGFPAAAAIICPFGHYSRRLPRGR